MVAGTSFVVVVAGTVIVSFVATGIVVGTSFVVVVAGTGIFVVVANRIVGNEKLEGRVLSLLGATLGEILGATLGEIPGAPLGESILGATLAEGYI